VVHYLESMCSFILFPIFQYNRFDRKVRLCTAALPFAGVEKAMVLLSVFGTPSTTCVTNLLIDQREES